MYIMYCMYSNYAGEFKGIYFSFFLFDTTVTIEVAGKTKGHVAVF